MDKKTLEQLRKESGMNKMQFSKMLGVPYTSYLRYEADLKPASFGEVKRICEKLGIEITQIAC